MNILFVDQFTQLGGAQRCLRDLIPAVLDRGWRAHAALPGHGPLEQSLRELGVEVHDFPISDYGAGRKSVTDFVRFGRDLPRARRAIADLVERFEIDLVYVNGPRALPAAALAAERIVFHAHSLLTQGYARALAGWSLRRRMETTVIAACQFVAKPLEGYVPNLRIVYSGVAGRPHKPRRFDTRRPARIGVIGRIAPEKGQLDFVKAAQRIAQTLPDAAFVVAGAPMFSARGYADRVRSHAEGVEFPGWCEDAGALMEELDVVAVPSAPVDAAPRVVLEAMAAGTPVVAYPSGGIPELISDGENGVLTRAQTPDALAGAILELVADPERRARISEAGRQTWEDRFTIERYRREILEVLDRCAQGRPARCGT